MKSLNRRKFFNMLSLGAIGTMLLNTSLKMFIPKRHNIPSNIKVKLNPNSVKRNK